MRAIETFGDAFEGSDRPLVIASGGPVGTEHDALPASPAPGPRSRSSIVRVSPTVHDRSKCDMVAQLASIAREKGVSGYLGDGSNRWPSAHRLDVARLFRLAVEKAPAGSVQHGVGEEGVTIRTVAEVIGRHVNVPVTAIAAEDAGAHFGFLARFLGLDMPASNTLTRELLGWQPTHLGLIADLEHLLRRKETYASSHNG
jgi:nucleoside-diphosphate-sugar epimerase